MNSTNNYMQMMKDSLIMKKSILEKLVALNEEQRTIAEAADFSGEKLQDNVDKKSELVDEILRLDDGFDGLYSRVKQELETNRAMYGKEIQTIQSLIRDVTDLSVKVQAGEARNKLLVEKAFNGLRRNLQQTKRSSNMANAYYQSMNKIEQGSYFMDKKN